MINKNDSPTGDCNKFLHEDEKGETTGHRGYLLATSDDKTEAVILGATGGLWGEMWLVKEKAVDCYPIAVGKVKRIPASFTLVLADNA